MLFHVVYSVFSYSAATTPKKHVRSLLKHPRIISNFGGVSHFSTFQYFKHGNLWSFSAPLLDEIETYIH